MFSRFSTCCSSRAIPGTSIFSVGCWLSSFYGIPGNPAPTESSLPQRSCPQVCLPTTLLDNDLLLLRIDPALRRLGRHRNHGFSGGQRGCEVMETAVRAEHRNLTAIDHDPRSGLCLARHFNHMPMLNERIQFQFNGLGLLAFGNNREAVFLALH